MNTSKIQWGAEQQGKTGDVDTQSASTVSMANTEQANELSAASNTTTLDPALRRVIEEITGNITSVVNQKVDSLAELLKGQSAELKDLTQRATDAEFRIATQEEGLDQASARIQTLEKHVLTMAERIDDLENKGRRKNVRVLGLKEGIESDMGAPKFLEEWLPEFLQIKTKHGRIKVERAHRTLTPPPGPAQRPRPMLIRFHNYSDQQRVLAAARRMGTEEQPLTYKGSRIMFFQDFSAETTCKRKRFDAVKQHLREAHVQYSLLYPARLKIIYNGNATVFDSPEKAEEFVNGMR